MEELVQWLTLNIDKLCMYLGISGLSFVSLWKCLSLIIQLIKNGKVKKNLNKIKEYEQKTKEYYNELIPFIEKTIEKEMLKVVEIFINSLNNSNEKILQEKQRIYSEIFNKNLEVKEIINDKIEQEIEQITTKDEEVEIQPKIEGEKYKKKVDLL